MSDSDIKDREWWNGHTELFRKLFLVKLEEHKEWYGPDGNSRIDGNSLCPRCSSPNYAMLRMSKKTGQPRSDDPHYYGKHCFTCSYSFDPKKEVSK